MVPAIDEALVPEVSPESLSQPIVMEEDSAILFLDHRAWHERSDGSRQPNLPRLGERVVFTESFLPLHMRKLWVHNMVHALIGYLGHYAGHTLIYDAVEDPRIEKVAKRAMQAIGGELYRRWSYHETQHSTLDAYITWRWARYCNKGLNDTVSRVCRDPERKLKRDDRLVGPVNYIRKYAAKGTTTDNALVDILVGAVAALHYAAEVEGANLSSLRARVQDDLVNVDSEFLNRAEQRFAEIFR